MMFLDTPVGEFRILLDGEPVEFDVYYGHPVHFRLANGDEIISANSYIASICIDDYRIYDIISGGLETPVLYYSGCIAGMDSMMCHLNNCSFELSTPYTAAYEDDPSNSFLPYESYSFNPHGFAFRITDDPKNYNSSPMQHEICFIIAWAFTDIPAWSSQSFDLLTRWWKDVRQISEE